jgi:xanthine dehydrogenase YagR molybdenum-binding subunit
MTTAHLGKPARRVDGRAKVTGAAKYAAEYNVPDLAHGCVVSSAVARGKIVRIDLAEALRVPGVLQVFTHQNLPKLARSARSYQDQIAPSGSPFRPLHDEQIRFSAQPIALVVADSFETARYAASLVRVEYQRQAHATDLTARLRKARAPRKRGGIDPPPPPRGDAQAALAAAAVKVEAEYLAPVEHHNPMEPFATTVVRDEDGSLTVYDKTQGVVNVRDYLSSVFRLRKDEVRVVSPFVGGAFGSGLRPQYQVFLAVLAARELKRSVRVVLTRQQMFSFGHRPATWQRVALGAAAGGRLEAVIHQAVAETSRFEDYVENVVNWSGLLYRCDNVLLDHRVAELDLYTPADMRAPGAVWGLFALECAMDELAAELRMDPLELRLKNYAEKDQNRDLPFSTKELRECYRQGAERFGWARRDPRPRSMREGHTLIGWGMAGGAWEAQQLPAAARALLTADSRLTVSSATADIGTGTYTIMTQVAAETLGLPLANVTFKLGDSYLPEAPVEGGSFTAATVGPAVEAACARVRQRLFKLAREAEGPLAGVPLEELVLAGGQIRSRSDPARAISIAEAMRHAGIAAIEEEASTGPSPEQEKHSSYTHSAVFAEVKVDEDFGTVRVSRVVSAVAAGRILNPRTARSQVLGAVVGGIGTALEEESVIDHVFGRFMNHNLAEYHIPVNADVEDIEVLFVKEEDRVVNPLGSKGLGEIGIVGVAAAIANAVFHATGKRVRELPITPGKLL